MIENSNIRKKPLNREEAMLALRGIFTLNILTTTTLGIVTFEYSYNWIVMIFLYSILQLSFYFLPRKAVNNNKLDNYYLIVNIDIVNISLASYVVFTVSLIKFFKLQRIYCILFSIIVFLITLVWLICIRKKIYEKRFKVNIYNEHHKKITRIVSIPLVMIIASPLAFRANVFYVVITVAFLLLGITFEYTIFSCYVRYLIEKDRKKNKI